MRLDKFLKISRLIKRRTVAKEMCDKGRAEINSRPAKAGTDVSVGDEISLRFGNKKVVVQILQIAEHTAKQDASDMYKILSENQLSE